MLRSLLFATAAFGVAAGPAAAHGPVDHAKPPSHRLASAALRPSLDLTSADVTVRGRTARFRLDVRGSAGSLVPRRTGTLAGSAVQSYVWPTSLDPSVVGFPAGSGILTLAVTSHPDFDDTPLFDENHNGDRADDGRAWHSHWVVLGKDAGCGGGLKVVDIQEGASPALPATWPGLPLLIDSPGWQPIIDRRRVEVDVPFGDPAVLQGARFDAVTAALQISADLHAPLLCVTKAHDVLSGDLSLPSTVAFAAKRGGSN